MSQLDAYAQSIKRTATFISRTLPPDGDWVPVLVYETANGKTDMIEAPSLASEQRHQAIQDLSRHMRAQNAVAVCLVHMVWIVDDLSQEEVDKVLDGSAPRASEHPNRKEAVSIIGFDRDGQQVATTAIVQRREGQSPLLGEWDERSSDVEGDLVDALRWSVGAPQPTSEGGSN